jgi:hypothetical protein
MHRMKLAPLACAVLVACAPEAEVDEEVVSVQSNVVTSTFVDDSASPVHIQVKACTADTFARTHMIECSVDSGFALVGGGAYVQYVAGGALLTESRPVDGRIWRARSKDHQNTDNHKLTTYAVGLRLDGVNAATLRGMITRTNATSSGSVASPNMTVAPGSLFLSGGARANTSGVGQLLTRTYSSAAGTWRASSKDHLVSSVGSVTAYATRLLTSGIIEPFGQLEVQQQNGSTSSSGTGVRTSTASVSSGWALIGYGGQSEYTSGSGRMLFRTGINGTNPRSVSAQSKDQGGSSTGTVRSAWSQARHRANSHGLCNPGGPLVANMDPCVASICAVDSFCCNSLWDPQCVNQVGTVCGKSCANFTCSTQSYNPGFWNDDFNVTSSNNCYNYGVNKRTDNYAQPGHSSGEECPGGGYTVACVTEKAKADGLIPATGPNECPWDQQTVALVVRPDGVDYHWYRLDSDGMWTHKFASNPATNLDDAMPGQPITNPETANRGLYTTFGGYFCTCSDSVEGNGHAVVSGDF